MFTKSESLPSYVLTNLDVFTAEAIIVLHICLHYFARSFPNYKEVHKINLGKSMGSV